MVAGPRTVAGPGWWAIGAGRKGQADRPRRARSRHRLDDGLCLLDRELEALDRGSPRADEDLPHLHIKREADGLAAEGVRMRFIGARERLDPKLQALMAGIEARTVNGT